MYIELLKTKLFEQLDIYRDVKAGNVSSVQYCKYRDEKYGLMDSNYVNRMRLAYYLLYANIFDVDKSSIY